MSQEIYEIARLAMILIAIVAAIKLIKRK